MDKLMVSEWPYGKIPVRLLVDLEGLPEGGSLKFEIFKLKNGKKEPDPEVFHGVVSNRKGICNWYPRFEERKDFLSLKKEIKETPEKTQYHFTAKYELISGKVIEVTSEDITFSYDLEIYLIDEEGHPLNNEECMVTFSDQSEIKKTFKGGYVKFEKVPPGKFKLAMKKSKFIFEK